MTLIEDSAVDAMCADVERVPPSRIPAEMDKASRNQPELVAFLLGSTDGLAPGVSELTGFIYYVIWRTVCQETRGRLGPISSDAIQATLEKKERDLARLDDLDPALLDTTTFAQITRQPALFRYMLETIAATEEAEPHPLQIPPEDKASVIILLSTAIDLLDEARSVALGESAS